MDNINIINDSLIDNINNWPMPMKQCEAIVMHCKLHAATFKLTKVNKNLLVHPLQQVYVIRKFCKHDKNLYSTLVIQS